MLACILGGVLAGVAVAVAASRSREPMPMLASGGLIAVRVGAFGCACVGYGGMAGMILGTAASLSVTRLFAPAR